jgi:hypothetical protein
MRMVTMLPALEEEAAIGSVVRAISRALVHEVLVVHNGRRDGPAAVAPASGTSRRGSRHAGAAAGLGCGLPGWCAGSTPGRYCGLPRR